MQKLLIVDDESIQRTLVKRFLTGKKLTIMEAADGPTALKMLKTDTFDLLLFDDMMPGMNGVDLLTNLRELKANPNCKVPAIAMTGRTGSDIRYTYIRAGFAEYLKKPVDKEALIEAIRSLIGPDFLGEDEEKKKPKPLPAGDGAKSSARALLSKSSPESTPAPAMQGSISRGGTEEKSAGTVEEIPGVPRWMSDMPEIDAELGIRRNGSAEGLLSAVRIFSNSAQSKADEIEDFYWRGDVRNYTIKVHALKSSAQIIGANDLATKAEKLEIAGETGDYDTIKKENGDFLLDFRALARTLKDGIRNTAISTEKHENTSRISIQRRVALLSSKEHVLVGGMENKLIQSGVRVDRMPTTLKEIENWYTEAQLYVYYMDEEVFERNDMLLYLRDLCIGEEKSLILIGTAFEYQEAIKSVPESCILKWYERPFDMEEFLRDVSRFFDNYGKSDVKKQILIIDDDETYMMMIESWLSDIYQIEMANSGLQAIRWLAKNRPDLVLLDYEMPITNGPQLLAMMKSEVGTSNIPVMFLTGKQDRNSVMTGLNLKPVDYLLKTIDRNSLREKLEVFFKMRLLEKR